MEEDDEDEEEEEDEEDDIFARQSLYDLSIDEAFKFVVTSMLNAPKGESVLLLPFTPEVVKLKLDFMREAMRLNEGEDGDIDGNGGQGGQPKGSQLD